MAQRAHDLRVREPGGICNVSLGQRVVKLLVALRHELIDWMRKKWTLSPQKKSVVVTCDRPFHHALEKSDSFFRWRSLKDLHVFVLLSLHYSWVIFTSLNFYTLPCILILTSTESLMPFYKKTTAKYDDKIGRKEPLTKAFYLFNLTCTRCTCMRYR